MISIRLLAVWIGVIVGAITIASFVLTLLEQNRQKTFWIRSSQNGGSQYLEVHSFKASMCQIKEDEYSLKERVWKSCEEQKPKESDLTTECSNELEGNTQFHCLALAHLYPEIADGLGVEYEKVASKQSHISRVQLQNYSRPPLRTHYFWQVSDSSVRDEGGGSREYCIQSRENKPDDERVIIECATLSCDVYEKLKNSCKEYQWNCTSVDLKYKSRQVEC